MSSKLLFAALSLMLAADAFATDGKSLPGSSCVPTDATRPAYSQFRVVNGYATNPSTNAASFICPILRDDHSASSVLMADQAFVWVLDQNTSASVSCTLTYRTFVGPTLTVSFNNQAATPGGFTSASPQRLDFTSAAAPFPARSIPGWYYMGCTVPGPSAGRESGVVSYYWEELN